MPRHMWIVFVATAFIACGGEKQEGEKKTPAVAEKPTKSAEGAPKQVKPAAQTATGKVLLVTASEFKADDKGDYTVPDAAVMLILRNAGSRWVAERIEDRESNVFHKALPYGKEGILTLGGNEAKLKWWKKKDGKWQAETLWHPTFGGKHNRLRDFEMADFNGDGKDDLAIATHDQGVVAVVWRRGDKWEPEELDRQADTFVHEIEIGDLDGNGKLEFYATPSQPNTVSGKDQGGKVVRFAWTGEKFEKSEVVSLETRHIKEILVADVDGDGKQELYAALEAEVDGMTIKAPVEIRRFDLKDGKFASTVVTTINDRFCRFLVAGDIDQDGKQELVAAAFSTGVWVIEKDGDGHAKDGVGYTKKCIDTNSGGFEHAAYIADLEGDGKEALYVADDRSGTVKRYSHSGGQYKSVVLNRRVVPSQAMVWNITEADL
ncbi:MAG: VCBS repeat-containing protein [Deltaproteobacteria bacterium]|nr:VCBS repeat-containing protein [Deltaproteobacteria bacterium]